MAKTFKEQAKKSSGKSSFAKFPNVTSYFKQKLEAEWGPYDLKRALDKRSGKIVVLDTRDTSSFNEEHLPQAVNIPTDLLEQRLSELPKNKEVVPYCWSITCHLATRAALLLAKRGYRVHELAGGIELWKEHEFPLVRQQEAAVH
jgi:rhodanese-related sulfurtransferase